MTTSLPLMKIRHSLVAISLLVWLQACNDSSFQGAKVEKGNALQTSEDATSVELEVPGVLPDKSTELEMGRIPDKIVQSFSPSGVQSESFTFAVGPRNVSMPFTLEDLRADRKDSLSQLTRAALSQSFRQGHASQPVNESFTQSARKGPIDIVVVIDNSSSMSQEQANLASRLSDLLVSIKDASWQINVITTSPALPAGVGLNDAISEGKELCQSTLIKAGEVDAASKFSKAVTAGTSGNGNEQGIRQAVVGLRCTENPWLRANAPVAVLIVSDEDNCSNGKGCGTLPWSTETYLTNYIENSLGRVIGQNAGLYGLISPSAALCPTGNTVGTQYMRLFAYKANGAVNYGNICDASYTTTLNRISDSIANLLNSQFELKTEPDAGSLKISIKASDGSISIVDPNNYTLAGRIITFKVGQEPALTSTVLADYKAGATPVLKSFTLNQDPAADTLAVKVNGQLVAAANYSVSGRTITFAQAPADMADIMVDFRMNTPLQTSFTTSALPLTGSLKVSVNGQESSAFTFDAASKNVIFAQAPADGASIELSYQLSAGPRLSYALPLGKDASNIRILDQNQTVAFTLVDTTFTIDSSAFQLGKILTLVYDLPETAVKSFALPHQPLAGTAVLQEGSGACNLGAGFEVIGAELSSTCMSASSQSYTLNYKYFDVLHSFVMTQIEHPDVGTWAVYIDGTATTDFTRKDATITLNFDLSPDSKLEILYTAAER